MSSLNQIEEIGKLYAKYKTYKIPKSPMGGQPQIEVKIMPLGLKDMDLMNIKEDSSITELKDNVRKIWSTSLEINEEDAEKISLEFMKELMDAFMDANNFKEEDMKKTGIKDFIKEKQNKAKEEDKDEKKESDRES